MMSLVCTPSTMTCFRSRSRNMRTYFESNLISSYQRVLEARKKPDIQLDPETADVVAQAMRVGLKDLVSPTSVIGSNLFLV